MTQPVIRSTVFDSNVSRDADFLPHLEFFKDRLAAALRIPAHMLMPRSTSPMADARYVQLARREGWIK
jgi:hypothetical protein